MSEDRKGLCVSEPINFYCLHFFLSSSFVFLNSYVINVFLLIYQLGTCCVYVVFVSSNIKGIVDLYTKEEVDVRLIMLITLLPLIFLNWVCVFLLCLISLRHVSLSRFAISSFSRRFLSLPTLLP